MRVRLFLLAAVLLAGCRSRPVDPPDSGFHDDAGVPDAGPEVLQHHKSATRDGLFVDAAFTRAAAAGLHLDPGFSATVNGHVYAQPLFARGGGGTPDLMGGARESNEGSALTAAPGAPLGRRPLGPPMPLSQLPCGNIDPLGITGTPIADAQARTL